MSKPSDLIGRKYGRLTVIERVGSINGNSYFKCLCECGKETTALGYNLKSGAIKSCGCYKMQLAERHKVNLIGQKSGRLTVIEEVGHKNGKAILKCKCDCGVFIEVYKNHFRSGNTQSCGCLVSRREEEIARILQNNNVSFRQQYTFSDLRHKRLLKFDFAIFTNETLLGCVEFDGMQHYVKGIYDESLVDIQKRDLMKDTYCLKHSIPLNRIRYNEEITLERILRGMESIASDPQAS